jgi:hypothetical protein
VATALFTMGWGVVVIATIAQHPTDSVIGLAILAAGLPAYLFWRGKKNYGM